MLGEGVEEFVRRHVIGLTCGRDQGGGGGEQHDLRHAAIGQEAAQKLRAIDLGRQDGCGGTGILAQKRGVIDRARRMDDAMDRAEFLARAIEGRAHVFRVADICGEGKDLTQPLQAGKDARPDTARRGQAAPNKGDLCAMVAHEAFSDGHADAAEATGDDPDRALRHRGGLRQGCGGDPGFIAARPAQGGHCIAGAGEHLFQHEVDRVGGDSAAAFGQGDVQERGGQAGEFARHDADRTADGGLFRVGQRLFADLRRAGGEDGQMRQGLQPRFAEGLTEEEEAPEPLFHVAVEEAGTGAEGFGIGDQPGMGDAVGRQPALHQIGQKRVIAFAAMFRGEGVGFLARPGEGIACMDCDDTVACGAQALHGGAGEARLIGEDQPSEGRAEFGFHIDDAIGRGRAPCEAIAEIGHGAVAGGQRFGILHRGGQARFDEIARALEGIGGQRHAVTAGLAPELRPVRRRAAGPEAAQRGDEVAVVGGLVVGVAEAGGDGLPAHHAIGLRQRRQRATGAHLQIDAVGLFAQGGDALRKADGAAQMGDPVIGAGRLGCRKGFAAAVGDDGNLRRRERHAGQMGAEIGEDRFQHLAVGRDVDGDAGGVDPIGLEPLGQRLEPVIGAGDDGEFGGVDGGDVQIAQIGGERRFRERHGKHPACRDGVEELAAQVDEADHAFQRHHARDAGGGVFAHGMADEGCGLDAPAFPQAGQRDFHDQDQRELQRGAAEAFGGLRLGPRFGKPEGADVDGGQAVEDGEAPVHPFGEDRFGFIEVARHVRILRAAAGEHEDDIGRVAHPALGEDAAGIGGFQHRGRLVMGGGDEDAAMFEGATAFLQGEGHIGERLFRMGAQMGGKALRRLVQRRWGAGREDEELEGPVAFAGGGDGGGLFEDDMGVGAADA